MKRWYDKNEKLAKQLNNLTKAPVETKQKIIKGLLDIIQDSDKEFASRFKGAIDIEHGRRRVYVDEAATWIIINNLKYADESLLQKVTEYIEKEISSS